MMHSAKKGINLVHYLGYIHFVLKDFFLIVLKLQKILLLQQKWQTF